MYLIINNSYGDINPKATPKLILFFKQNKIKHKVINTKSELIKYINNNVLILGIILSGSDLSYIDNSYNKININLIVLLELNVPILGICFGFQTIGLFYGGTLSKLTYPNKGTQEIIIDNNNILFKKIKKNYFYQYHNDYLKEIPHNFSIIARNNDHIINGIKHKYKPIFGLQFHPELSGKDGFQILHNFIQFCSNY